MEAKNSLEVNVILRKHKLQSGDVNFPSVLSIPVTERLPMLAEKNFKQTLAIINVGVTMALENMNLKRPMNEIQILDLSEAIIDTSLEDQLSLEDLMLFLQGLVRGDYGVMYDSMDIPKFMEKFEIYREKRYRALKEYQYNKHLEKIALGSADRTCIPDPLDAHFSNITGRLEEMKERLKEKTRENNNLKKNL